MARDWNLDRVISGESFDFQFQAEAGHGEVVVEFLAFSILMVLPLDV